MKSLLIGKTKKLTAYMLKNKTKSAIAVVILLAALYWGYGKLNSGAVETKYVLATVTKGTIISSVTGTGQVSALNEVDIKPKASGDIIYLGVSAGQTINAGTLIAKLDTTDAERTVRDAEMSLESAKITLEKLKGPDTLSKPRNTEQAEEDLAKAYDDGFNAVSNAFLDLPEVMSGLQDILYGTTLKKGQDNVSVYADAIKDYDERILTFKEDAIDTFRAARTAYDDSFINYKSITRYSDKETIEKLISEIYDTTRTIADAVKSSNNMIQFYIDKLTERNLTYSSTVSSHMSSLNSFTGTTNSHLTSLLNAKSNIKSATDSVSNADLDLRSQALSIEQKENALADAKTSLANYYIYAPFDGTIASVDVKKYDSVSSGTVIATLVTRQKIAEMSLNEVDAAKVKVGQKVNLTFDAIEDLQITGKVAEVDTVGTVTQGVVTYSIKISFDTQDDRVKSGMSTSATIITDVKQDVLVVSSSSIQTTNEGESYVETFSDLVLSALNVKDGEQVSISSSPIQKSIKVGIFSDTETEITSGLKEGDRIIVRTITSKTTTTSSTKSGSINLFGGGGGQR